MAKTEMETEMEIEKERARRRRMSRLKQFRDKHAVPPSEGLTEKSGSGGEAIRIVAKKHGLSHNTLIKGREILRS